MITLKQYIKACKKYDFSEVKKYLENLQLSTFEEIKSHINMLYKSVNFKEQELEEKELRKKFFQELSAFFNNSKITNFITNKLAILEYLESAFIEIEKTRESHVFYQNDKNFIICSLIKTISTFTNKKLTNLYNLDSDDLEEVERLGAEIDSLLSTYSGMLAINLKYFAHSEEWFSKEFFLILPDDNLFYNEKCIATDQDLNFSIYIATMWTFIENRLTEWRHLDSQIYVENISTLKNCLEKKDFNELSKKYKKYLSYETPPLEEYAYVSQVRLRRMLGNISADIHLNNNDKNNPIKNDKDKESFANIEGFCQAIHATPKTQFGRLTVEQWLSCFFTLNQEARNSNELIIYTFDELINKLPDTISRENKSFFIDVMTFKENTLDVFDAPLLKIKEGKILFLSFFWHDINYVNVFLSVAGKNKINVGKKGALFEKHVLELFQHQKLKAFPYNKKIGSDEYEYDAIVIWDNYIFIIEAKNRTILNPSTHSMKDFNDKAEKYIKQVSRLTDFFKKNIKDIEIKFDVNLSEKKVVPIILNALPFSLDRDVDGIYFLDYSILAKFFSCKHLRKKNIKTGEMLEIIHTWWSEDTPTAEDFYKILQSPFHVTNELKNIDLNHGCLRTENFFFLTNEITIKSEPLLTLKKLAKQS